MNKTLRVLFVLIFLLSLSSLRVQAQGAPTALAYLPLLTQSAGSLSPEAGNMAQLHVLARQAYESLAPKLMQAQQTGQVLRFAPDLSAGLVMVEYVAGSNLASLLGTRQPVFDTPQAVLAYTRAGQAIRNQSVPAGTAPYIYLAQDSCTFWGGNLGAGNTYKASLKDAAGHTVAVENGTLDSNGNFFTCFSGIWSGIVPGFTFNFKLYNSAGSALLNTYTTPIPRVDLDSASPATKISRGTASAGSLLHVELFHQKLDATGGTTFTNRQTTATSAGAWQVNFSPAAMRGGDEVEVFYYKPSTIFMFNNKLFAPSVTCNLGGDYCAISDTPGAAASLSIKHSGNTYTFTGKFDASSYFTASLYNAHMEPIFLKAGDQASGTGVTTLTLSKITTTPNYASDLVTGEAPANRYIDVQIKKYDPGSGGWNSCDRWVKTSAAGTYSADFSSLVTVTSKDTFYANVFYYDPATGNETDYQHLMVP